MNYLDAGYNQFLQKNTSTNQVQSQLDPLAFEEFTQEVSGSKVQGGILQTTDGKTILNLEEGYFAVSDGTREIIRLGVQADGSIGVLIVDRDGSDLIRFTGDTNVLKSPNGNLEINFDTVQFLIKDDGGTPVVLLGKQIGGF